jgi:hypothetical protein
MNKSVHMRFPDGCDFQTGVQILSEFQDILHAIPESETAYLIVEIGNFVPSAKLLRQAKLFLESITHKVTATAIVGKFRFRDIVVTAIKPFANREMMSFEKVAQAYDWFEIHGGAPVKFARPNNHVMVETKYSTKRVGIIGPVLTLVAVIAAFYSISILSPPIKLYISDDPGMAGLYVVSYNSPQVGDYVLVDEDTVLGRFGSDQKQYLIKEIVANEGTVRKHNGYVYIDNIQLKFYVYPSIPVWEGDISPGWRMVLCES